MGRGWIIAFKAWLRAGKPEVFLPPPKVGQKYLDYCAKANEEARRAMDLRIPSRYLQQSDKADAVAARDAKTEGEV